ELHSRGGERVVVADDRRELEGDGLRGRGGGLNQHDGGEERDEALHRGLHGGASRNRVWARPIVSEQLILQLFRQSCQPPLRVLIVRTASPGACPIGDGCLWHGENRGELTTSAGAPVARTHHFTACSASRSPSIIRSISASVTVSAGMNRNTFGRGAFSSKPRPSQPGWLSSRSRA